MTIDGSAVAENVGTHDTGTPDRGTGDVGTRDRFGVAPVATALLVGAAFLAYAVSTGLSVAAATTMTMAVLAFQVIPGVIVWRSVRPRRGWLLEDLAMGFALGICLAIVAQVAAGLARSPWLGWLIPWAVVAPLIAISRTRRRIATAGVGPLPAWWGLLAAIPAVGALPQLASYFSQHPLRYPPGAWAPHVDVYLHLSLAGQLLHRGPTSWPTVVGEDLGYHWFTHAWIAHVAGVSGAGLDEVLLRFMPAVMPVVVPVTAAVAALRLSRRPGLGIIAAWLTMLGGNLNPWRLGTPGHPTEPLSPTLALGAPTLIALVVVLAVRWRGESLRGMGVLVPVLAVASAGTKGSTLPLIVAGLGLAVLAMALWNRGMAKPVLIDFGVVSAALIGTMVVVFHGSSAGLKLGLPEAAGQTLLSLVAGELTSGRAQALAILVTILAAMSRGIGVFLLPASREGRRDPLSWLLIGATVAGAVAVGIFSHPGWSQGYFARSAAPVMAIGSALGLGAISDRIGSVAPRAALFALATGSMLPFVPFGILGPLTTGQVDHAAAMLALMVAFLLLAVVAGALALRGLSAPMSPVGAAVGVGVILVAGVSLFIQSTLTRPVRTDWGQVAMDATLATTQEQIDAARWIRDNSDVDDIVMTNRHCTVPREPSGGCDSRRWVVTAFSERQSLVEGWTATPRATEIAPEGRDSITVDYWRPEVLRLNDEFIAAPTAESAEQLREMGVRWVYVDHTRPYAPTLEPYAELRFSNGDVDVYELTEAG